MQTEDEVTTKRKIKVEMASASSWLADWLVNWSFVLNWVSLALIALTVILGGMTIVAGKISSDRQEATIQGLKLEAAKTNKNTETLRAANLELRGQVATIEKAAAEAKTAQLQIEATVEQARAETAAAKEGAAKANEGVKVAELELERQKKENLKLSLALMHSLRELRQRKVATDSPGLREVHGVDVELVAIPDEEAAQVVTDIGTAAEVAGWKIIDFNFEDEHQLPVFPGVTVRYGTQDEIGQKASEALVEALRICGLTAKKFPKDLPNKTIRVLVGRNDKLDSVLDLLEVKELDVKRDFEPTRSMPYLRWNQAARKERGKAGNGAKTEETPAAEPDKQ